MSSWIMRRATPHDWPKLAALLAMADLPLAGVEAHLSDFFLAFRDDVLIGAAGLERYGDTALLRSVAVVSTERRQGLGEVLVQQALAYAVSLEVRQVVLLTTTAADFFLRFGFQPMSRAEVPLAAQASVEFQGICPASATGMSLVLEVEERL
jgi:amino-acid N-acetyltransferase